MREIKFRFYAKDTKRMISWEEACKIGLRKNDFTEDDNWCPLQFTGLLDKNGKEIYEGDIVKWGHAREYSKENPVRIAEVKFNPDIQFHSQVGIFKFGNFAYLGSIDKDIEVIGNIFENPDLLTSHKA